MAKQPVAETVVALGPFGGLNTVDDPLGAPFQPGGDVPPALRVATNVDLDRLGWPRRRQGRTKVLALTAGHALASVGGRLLVADNGSLLEVEPSGWTTRTITGGLEPGASVCFVEAGGEVYWSDGVSCGRIGADGTAKPWGLATPALPRVDAGSAGALRPGRYLVALTCEDASGLESGALATVPVEVTSTFGSIHITPGPVPTHAVAWNLYVSDTDGTVPLFVRSETVGAAAYAVHHVGFTMDPIATLGMDPPTPCSRLTLSRGRLLTATDTLLRWSQPLAFHHFHAATDIQMFERRIVLLEAMPDGFYIGLEDGPTYWVGGDDPENWQPRLVDTRPVAEGAAVRVQGRKLPMLQTDVEVAVWATSNGFVAGLPGGQTVHLSDGRVAMDARRLASLAYREDDGLRQILLNMRERPFEASFATGDHADCAVVRGAASASAAIFGDTAGVVVTKAP